MVRKARQLFGMQSSRRRTLRARAPAVPVKSVRKHHNVDLAKVRIRLREDVVL